jgi:hypothetical protein
MFTAILRSQRDRLRGASAPIRPRLSRLVPLRPMSLGSADGMVKLVIAGLRSRQNIKQKQQPKHSEEYEANVRQHTRSPGYACGKQQESVPKKINNLFRRCRRNDVSYSASNNGRGHKDNRTEVTTTYYFPHTDP